MERMERMRREIKAGRAGENRYLFPSHDRIHPSIRPWGQIEVDSFVRLLLWEPRMEGYVDKKASQAAVRETKYRFAGTDVWTTP